MRGFLSHPVDTEPEEVALPVPLADSIPAPGSALSPWFRGEVLDQLSAPRDNSQTV